MRPEPKTPDQCLARAFELEKTALEIQFRDPLGYTGIMQMAQSYLERGIEMEANPTVFYNNLAGSEGAV